VLAFSSWMIDVAVKDVVVSRTTMIPLKDICGK
jgi:hypothetical protein